MIWRVNYCSRELTTFYLRYHPLPQDRPGALIRRFYFFLLNTVVWLVGKKAFGTPADQYRVGVPTVTIVTITINIV